MDASDDELSALISRCSLRDQAALNILYKKVAPFLNNVAYKILRSEALSNEALQDGFVQIWNNASSYRQDVAKPLTWMCSIVRYRALDKLQSEQKHSKHIDQKYTNDDDEDIEPLDRIPHKDTPEKDYAEGQSKAFIDQCLESLNPNVRQSITLAYLQGYTREELAETLGINMNTVKSWLRRGSERLKKCLETKMSSST